MTEKLIVCCQSKKVKICRFIFIFNNYYIYLKRYVEKNVTNDFLVYSEVQLLKKTFLERKAVKQVIKNTTCVHLLVQYMSEHYAESCWLEHGVKGTIKYVSIKYYLRPGMITKYHRISDNLFKKTEQ